MEEASLALELEKLDTLLAEGVLTPSQYEAARSATMSEAPQLTVNHGAPRPSEPFSYADVLEENIEYPEGAEVEAVGLSRDAELNGQRGFVVGHRKAPDGELLTLVKFHNGSSRL
eukprot:Sspe_Gene.108418::Locus_87536_Transcript_1_1_Confidence_1.000_Length_662::g.108418::m.108418